MLEIPLSDIEDAAYGSSNLDLRDDAIRPSYGGRGMYERKCLGLVYSHSSDVHRFIDNLVEILEGYVDDDDALDPDEVREALIDGRRDDSMGLDGIAYWPNIQVV